jgi:hypothetical protein
MSRRLERAEAVWTRSAISIQARSCEDGCIMRPDTRQHLNLRSYLSKTPCFPRGVHTRTFCYRPADGGRCVNETNGWFWREGAL